MRTPKFLVKIGRFFRKNGPIMLSAVGVAGVVGTFALTIKANGDAVERKEDAVKEKGEELTKWETIKAEAPAYILPGAVCLATSATIVINAIVNRKIQAGLVAAACTATKAYDRVRAKLTDEQKQELVKEEIEEKKDIVKTEYPIDENLIWWYDTYCDISWQATLDEVRCAELNVANAMLYYGAVSFSNFLSWAGVSTSDIPKEAYHVGWSTHIGEAHYGYTYVMFDHIECELKDGIVCTALEYPFTPHADYLDDY